MLAKGKSSRAIKLERSFKKIEKKYESSRKLNDFPKL